VEWGEHREGVIAETRQHKVLVVSANSNFALAKYLDSLSGSFYLFAQSR